MLKGYMACAVAAVCLAAAGCSLRKDYTVVEGVMLGTSLRVVADVGGVGKQELYAAVMELDREAKASMPTLTNAAVRLKVWKALVQVPAL